MHKKGNISILVILVLMASALLGILTMNFVQQMMKSSATIYNYYQSYYLAKGGLEFGLAELSHRGVGFEQTLASGNALASGNFLCGSRCDMWFAIVGTSKLLSNTTQIQSECTDPYILSGHSSLLVPLFRDVTSGDLFLPTIKYQNLYGIAEDLLIDPIVGDKVTFGMLILSGEDLYSDGVFFKEGTLDGDLKDFFKVFASHFAGVVTDIRGPIDPYRFYFMISNPATDSLVSFCLQSKEPLPTQQYYLKSRGKYDDQQLGLEAVYKQPIPDFLVNGYMNY